MENFGVYLKQKRRSLGMTQSVMAQKLGVSWITIWRWESNIKPPASYKIAGIKETLNSMSAE